MRWDRHATTTVSGVPHLSGREMLVSSREVIGALGRRRETAPSPPPAGFWRTEVAEFSSPRSHAHAAEALLREGDLDGAMGLLVHWASLLEGVEVERLGTVWLAAAAKWLALAVADRSAVGRNRVRRFLELIEANTTSVADCIERFAQRPEPRRRPRRDDGAVDSDDDRDDETPGSEESVAAAYETFTWRDSTDDGIDGGMLDVEGAGGTSVGGVGEIEHAAEFLGGLFRLLRQAVTTVIAADVADGGVATAAEIDSAKAWRHHLRRLRRTFVRAAGTIAGSDPAPPPGMPPAEYDRLRWQRDAAAEHLVDAAVQATETLWMLSARLHAGVAPRPAGSPSAPPPVAGSTKGAVGRLLAAILAGDATTARHWLEVVRGKLVGQPVLYVPLSRGGRPDRIVRARARERLLERLASSLPRLGLVAETSAVVHLAKALESRRPQGAASVSEFDRVFEAATTALAERIVVSARAPGPDGSVPAGSVVTERILDGLSLLVPRLLDTWMTHARQLRLSVLERVRDPRAFTALREFIEAYGAGLFTQHLLSPPSLRGILRGGVRRWLEDLVDRHGNDLPERGGPPRPRALIAALGDGSLLLKQASARMRLALECIAENHAEYRDWNSTTTQSDRGECLHILLDFLRLKAEYERIAWTLRPVNMAHRVLARQGMPEAAEAWRGRMRDETQETAAELVDKLKKLEAQWGVRLACIADRVSRPFTAVLEQDELEALVAPAVGGGSGVEVPDWLDRLGSIVDRELDALGSDGLAGRPLISLPDAVPWVPMAWDDLRKALEPRGPESGPARPGKA